MEFCMDEDTHKTFHILQSLCLTFPSFSDLRPFERNLEFLAEAFLFQRRVYE